MIVSEVKTVALRLFEAHGSAPSPWRSRLRGADVRTYLYRYFPGKDDMLQFQIDRGAKRSAPGYAARPVDEPLFHSLRLALEETVGGGGRRDCCDVGSRWSRPLPRC